MALPSSGPLTLADIQTEFGGTNPIGMNEYYAGGGLVPAGTSGTYGTVPSSGTLSVQNFYGTSAVIPAYIEEVFSAYLYNGNGSTQTITNGVNLSANGGMVWLKSRSAAYLNFIFDTVRGPYNRLFTNLTDAQSNSGIGLSAFNTNGFNLSGEDQSNANGQTYASWTFQKKPKFFDIVTFTKTVSGNQRIPHNLGSVPAMIIVKTINSANDWYVYHQSILTNGAANKNFLVLNSTQAAGTRASGNYWGNPPTTTDFGVSNELLYDGGSEASRAYIGYVFASNAGGFGLTGTDNVITCDAFTTDGSGLATINLGYEPQFVMFKDYGSGGDWYTYDTMRGLVVGADVAQQRPLYPNSSGVEGQGTGIGITNVGFNMQWFANRQMIYMAIRKGPMKVPTSGTSVFSPVAYTGNGSTRTYSVGFPTDLSINMNRNGAGDAPTWNDRLRGSGLDLYSNSTSAQADNGSAGVQFDNQTNIVVPSYRITSATPYINWCMRRAPSFFDEACYTGTGSVRTVTHNLKVVPELWIVKKRSGGTNRPWRVGYGNATTYMALNSTDMAYDAIEPWNNTTPTSSVFTVGTENATNESGATFVAYLFATCAGVSKVGLVTHVEPTTVVCGFVPRFVLLKSTTATGTDDWFVFDSARGITASNDPYLRLNSTGAENTPFGAADLIDVTGNGFVMNGFGGGNYIFLAIS
jgi:hypothetical protein